MFHWDLKLFLINVEMIPSSGCFYSGPNPVRVQSRPGSVQWTLGTSPVRPDLQSLSHWTRTNPGASGHCSRMKPTPGQMSPIRPGAKVQKTRTYRRCAESTTDLQHKHHRVHTRNIWASSCSEARCRPFHGPSVNAKVTQIQTNRGFEFVQHLVDVRGGAVGSYKVGTTDVQLMKWS